MIRKALILSAVITTSVLPPVATTANASTVNACVAYDLGGPGDRSYNDAVLAGLIKAKKTLSFNYEGFITDGSAADREKRIRAMIAKGCSPILVIGSGYAKLISILAMEFPTKQFTILNDDSIAVDYKAFKRCQAASLSHPLPYAFKVWSPRGHQRLSVLHPCFDFEPP